MEWREMETLVPVSFAPEAVEAFSAIAASPSSTSANLSTKIDASAFWVDIRAEAATATNIIPNIFGLIIYYEENCTNIHVLSCGLNPYWLDLLVHFLNYFKVLSPDMN